MNLRVLSLAQRWGPGALLAALVLLVWGQCVSFQFVWDDKYFIEELSSIRSLKNTPAMFYALDAQSSYPEGFLLFRPLRTLHYAVLFALGGGDAPKPWLFHFTNLAWHAAATILLFQVLLLVFVKRGDAKENSARWIAWLGAAAFAVHPVVSEVVCWAKSLDDIMATVFVLASCRMLLRNQEQELTRRNFGWAVIFFALALYSKESAVPFALFSLPLLAWRTRRGFWPALKLSLPFLAAAFVFMAHRHLVIGRTSQTAPISGSHAQTLIDTLPAGSIYARLLAGLPPFSIDYSYMTSGHALTTPTVLLGGGLVAGLIALMVFAFHRRQLLPAAGLLWLLLFMLPFSNLVPMMQFCAERFLYLPLVGWILALGGVALLLPRRAVFITGTIVLVGWSALAWQRSWIWRDPLTLFVQTHLEGPTSARVRDNAVNAAFDLPHMQRVFRRVKATGSSPTITTVADFGRTPVPWTLIEVTLAQLHQLFPDDVGVITAQAITYALQGRPAEAIPFFELVARQHPKLVSSWNNLSQACLAAGREAEAEQASLRAVALDANDVPSLEQLATIQWRRKNFSGARATYTKLSAARPAHAEYAARASEAERQLAASR